MNLTETTEAIRKTRQDILNRICERARQLHFVCVKADIQTLELSIPAGNGGDGTNSVRTKFPMFVVRDSYVELAYDNHDEPHPYEEYPLCYNQFVNCKFLENHIFESFRILEAKIQELADEILTVELTPKLEKLQALQSKMTEAGY